MKKIHFNIFHKYSWLQIFTQLLGEFYIPAVISLVWTYLESKDASPTEMLKEGMLHFFAVGWAFSQWNRVKKQIKAEKNIAGVGDDVKALLKQLEDHAANIIGYSTGGDSFCTLTPIGGLNAIPVAWSMNHHGTYPVFDIEIKILDSNVAWKYFKENRPYPGHSIHNFKALHPADIKNFILDSPITTNERGEMRLSFLFKTRAGEYRQELLSKPVSGNWKYATRVVRNTVTIWESVEEDFPRNPSGETEWYNFHN
ncbi:hypothetical protein [Duganella sp. FT27W]|uniref:hypothetical protein n=1 Tax=Duganella sp. FT27W TaxID=2654636 RepID=UPI00128CFBC6|nr:hypothetical protein [Duganella sp. FT27W]MPQ56243.1 hypothetical protein [Duganella sp. FT27W]